jgi:hypothetical protein
MNTLTWLDNRSEMIVFINDELGLYNDNTAQLLYEMTNDELKAICLTQQEK